MMQLNGAEVFESPSSGLMRAGRFCRKTRFLMEVEVAISEAVEDALKMKMQTTHWAVLIMCLCIKQSLGRKLKKDGKMKNILILLLHVGEEVASVGWLSLCA